MVWRWIDLFAWMILPAPDAALEDVREMLQLFKYHLRNRVHKNSFMLEIYIM